MLDKQILIIEDSEIQFKILERWITKQGYKTLGATTLKEAREIISNNKIDTVLLDWELPDGSGIELIKEILSFSSSGWLPIIMVTNHQNSERIKEAFEAGATDFVRKPAEEVELLARIYSALKIKALQDLLLESSIRDPLTGLYNRRYMDERIDQEFQRCKRHSHPITIAMLDIDYFKKVNDTYGHDMGDEVLKVFAHELKSRLRKSDIVSRYGGEEFVVALPETSIENAFIVLNKIRISISELTFRSEEGAEFRITFSGGLSGGKIESESSPADILKIADKNLYEAKHTGRNQILTST